jgi:hypothetical protein
MTRHNPIVRFQHMLDHAKEALEMIKGKNRSDLESNRQLELSLVRLVEIIGEAAGKLKKEDYQKNLGSGLFYRHSLFSGETFKKRGQSQEGLEGFATISF